MADFYVPMTGNKKSNEHYIKASKLFTFIWGVVQVATGMFAAFYLSRSMVDQVLDIQSFTNGVILGIFFLGTFTKRVQSKAAIIGIVAGAVTILYVKFWTPISWQWYVVIGSIVTFLVGVGVSVLLGEKEAVKQAEVLAE